MVEKCSECSHLYGIFCSNNSINSSKCPFVFINDDDMINYYMYTCCKGYE